ncbi:MAG: PilT/PilU family type 4a pilus ATPase [candidate division WS1 bacterium]|nr:PilT/PilU family type 4a pilus ATPase [candidate division WS1 bacterium]
MENWRDVVIEGASIRASDVFWKAGSHPHVRVQGKIKKWDHYPILTAEDTKAIAYELMTERHQELFEEVPERDVGLTVGDSCRLRINIFKQQNTIGLVMRIIPLEILTIDQLELPTVLKDVAMSPQGVVLVTGPTGSGKSTTLAAMIDHVNESREGNIVTIEDPIEYVHPDKKCIVNQREVGIDTMSFSDAMKYVVRQSPDVILIGEMRDVETMNVAMQAAETGHLVFSTVHTSSAAETMERIINMFPPHQRDMICLRMSKSLRAILSQALLPRAGTDGRVAAIEVLIANPTVAKMIEEGKPGDTYAVMQDGGYWGMQTRNQALLHLYRQGKVTARDALFYAGNYTEMRQMLRRVDPTEAEKAAREQPGIGGARGEVPDAQKTAAETSGRGGMASDREIQEKTRRQRRAAKRPDPQ